MTSEQGARLLELVETQNKVLEEIAKQGRAQCRFLKIMTEGLVVIADSVMSDRESEPSIYELMINLATEETVSELLATVARIEQTVDTLDQYATMPLDEDPHFTGDEP